MPDQESAPLVAGRSTESLRCSFGGIVLCGGRSSRMGRSKAMLPFGPERLLTRTVRLLAETVAPIVVVAAPDQELGDLPDVAIVARDREAHLGPLSGMLGGLLALEGQVQAAFVTGCDTPFLSPALVNHLTDLLGNREAVVPVERAAGRDRPHPLCAVYRLSIHGQIKRLLAAGSLRATELPQHVDALLVDVADLEPIDPRLRSLQNVNLPADYLAALREAGFAPPPEMK